MLVRPGANTLLSNEQHPIIWKLDTDSIRAIYNNFETPALLMLFSGIVCVWLLRGTTDAAVLALWAIATLSLTVLRFISAQRFKRTPLQQQKSPVWQFLLSLCACLSGLLLSSFAIVFIPNQDFTQQLVLLGLISLVAASNGIALAGSFLLFLCYAMFGFLPVIWVYLSAGTHILQGMGLLVLLYLVSLTVVVLQVNRLIYQAHLQRAKNQLLIKSLQAAQQRTEGLNTKLTQEIKSKYAAEQQLLAEQAGLEHSVSERTHELKEVLQAYEKSQERLELALNASQLALWDWNLETNDMYHTRTQSIAGLESEQVRGVLDDLVHLLHPDDLPMLRKALVEHMKQHTDSYAVEFRVKHKDGHWVWIEDRGRAVQRNAEGRVQRMLGTRRDITLRKQHDDELRLASSVFEAGIEGIVILDPHYVVLAVNKAFTAVTGFSSEDIVGRSIFMSGAPSELQRQYILIRTGIEQDGRWQGETINIRKNSEIYPQWLQAQVVRNNEGCITHIVGFFTDLTARRKTEDRLNHLTQCDVLTGLSNRALFHKRLHQAVDIARQNDGCLAVLHIDLDRFKVLNDSLGMDVADQVLRIMGQRLTQLLPGANSLARLGSNEFAIILDNCVTIANLKSLAESILEHIRLPVEIAGNTLVMSASLGISVLPDSAREPAALISQANMAMKYAKHLGGDSYQFYNDQLQTSTLERLQLEQQLRRGIEEGELQAYYQPKLILADGSIRSAEVLVRWNHPQRGLISPGEFIALAEETSLIGAISEEMLHQACEQAQLWLQQGTPIRVSVNLSVTQVRQGNLVTLVQHALEKTGLPAHLLELELTESQMLENAESIIKVFKQLRKIGVHIAIDDFGTGYSSLSYLKRFPVNSLKIDQSFIGDVAYDKEDAAITRAIIAMAHGLNLLVIAEGVETQEQMDFLKANNCDEIQGYLISRPITAEKFTEFLAVHQATTLSHTGS